MPRPSLKSQRRAEILDAYVRCVARHGLDGATQDRIAAEAGVARPLLRHNLGNREDMVMALVDHVAAEFDALTQNLFASDLSSTEIIEVMFAADRNVDPSLVLAFQALIAAAGERESLREPLLACTGRFIDHLVDLIAREAPNAPPQHRRAIATGVVAIYSSYEAMAPLAPDQDWRTEHRAAALALAQSLEQRR